MEEIKLGQRVEDKFTGFQGNVLGRAEYLSGVVDYLVSAKSIDGKLAEGDWFSKERLRVVKDGVSVGL